MINTLFNSTLYPLKEPLLPAAERSKTVAIESIGAGDTIFVDICTAHIFTPSFSRTDIEENGVRLHLTVVDTPGFGDFVNNDDRYDRWLVGVYSSNLHFTVGNQSWKTSNLVSTHILSKKTGSTGVKLLTIVFMLVCTLSSRLAIRKHTHIMAISSVDFHNSLKQLDIEFMRRLHTKVNLIPIIAKSDTLTDEEVAEFKERVRKFLGPSLIRF